MINYQLQKIHQEERGKRKKNYYFKSKVKLRQVTQMTGEDKWLQHCAQHGAVLDQMHKMRLYFPVSSWFTQV